MFPSFILFGKEIGTYTIMAIIGALLAGWLACRAAKRRGLDENDMLVTLLIAAIGVFIGSHLLYGLTDLPVIIALIRSPRPGEISFSPLPMDFLHFWRRCFFRPGLSRWPIGWYRSICVAKNFLWDLSATLQRQLSHCFTAFGRIGCFLGGCCYGVEVDWGIVYTNSLIPEANGVPRLPVQLIEAGFNLLLFCLLAAFAHPWATTSSSASALSDPLSDWSVCAGVFFAGMRFEDFSWACPPPSGSAVSCC